MAVEYEISSDVATVKGVASNTQVASVVKFYTGSITYDDEPTSKYASVTINGKTQRVMLCVAVSGTVNYDDVPCLYSTVSGHRTLNVVAPTESGTPDDVPSLYETVVVDGKTVRALRCVLINATPNYDGVSSTCTFTDNGKTHTAQLVNQVSSGSIETIVKGVAPLSLPDAIADSLSYVKAFGGTEQRNLPDGYTQLDGIVLDGSSYVDTGLTSFSNDGVYECDFVTSTLNTFFLFGQNPSTGCPQVGFFTTASNLNWQCGAGSRLAPNASANTTYSIVAENGKLITNGTTTTGLASASITINQHLFVGAGVTPSENPDSNTPDSRMFVGTINRFKYTLAGVVICDLVPVKRNSDNVLGFYDTARNTFLTNAGTGTFVAGGEAVPTPDTPMDIVSNNGVLKASKNLFDYNARQVGYYQTEGGSLVEQSGDAVSDFIRVQPNTTYYLSQTGSRRGKFFDANKQPIQTSSFDFASASSDTSFTTGATTYYVRFGMSGSAVDRTKIQLELGSTATPYMPYGEIYTDGTVETINAHRKNLFDINDLNIGSDASDVVKYKSYAVQNGTYTMSTPDFPTGSSTANIFFLAGNVSSGASSASNGVFQGTSRTINVSDGYYTVGYRSGQSNPNNPKDFNWQIEQGSTAFDGGTATAEMLLKVGDYQDVQSILDGVVTRKVEVKVLNGTENFETATATNCYSLTNTLGTGNFSDRTIMCSHFANTPTMPDTSDRQGLAFIVNKGPEYTIAFGATTQFSTQALWQQFLADQYAAGTPVIVLYPLATPTTESVAGQTLQVQDGDNTLEITQASLTGLQLEAKYQAAVSLTIQEVQDANLDPNVEVTIN